MGIATIALGFDQITKYLVLKNLALGETWSLFPQLGRLFQITYIKNRGMAFGMFPKFGGLFIIIAVIVIIAIVIFYRHLPIEIFWIKVSLGLQLGGATGNLLDRLTHNFVVDFIDIGFWPVFNLADLSIVAGVSILTYYLWDDEENGFEYEQLQGENL